MAILQEFLNLSFVQITEDGNVEKLKKVSTELSKRIAKDKAKIASLTITALDPDIVADNAEIVEVKNLITDYWTTFQASSKDTATTVIRAVILDTVQNLSKDNNTAATIWFASRNIIKYYRLGREKDLLTGFLIGIGNQVRQSFIESYTFLPDEELNIPEITSAVVDKDDIEAILKAASIHTAWGEGGENISTNATGDLNWAKFFSVRAAKGLAELLNRTLKKQASELKESQALFAKQNSILQMRTHLLWWRDAGYSIIYEGKYKDFKDGMLQIIMAVDFSTIVPIIYPNSIDYFLGETHATFSKAADVKTKISDILNSVNKYKAELKSILRDHKAPKSRIRLIDFIRGMVNESYGIAQLEEYVGIPLESELTLNDFLVWLCHDIHAEAISRTK